ncbi:MAG: hypothetical protein R3B07_37905 [Polyangiaceae bacterium]
MNYDLAFVVHLIENEEEARVDEVMLTSSTLHLDDVEACMTDALYGMRTPLEALALRQRKLLPNPTAPHSARALLGQTQVVQLLELMALIVVGYAVYTVVVQVVVDKPRTTRRPPPPMSDAPAEPEATSMPMATSMPTATTIPTATTVPVATAAPVARRYPKQTCDDTELDRLEKEKKKLCYGGYAADCAQSRSAKKLGRIPCSAIKLSILQRRACLAARQIIQDRCFGGKPDTGHKQQIDETQLGIDGCEAQKVINCAKDHPMAGL